MKRHAYRLCELEHELAHFAGALLAHGQINVEIWTKEGERSTFDEEIRTTLQRVRCARPVERVREGGRDPALAAHHGRVRARGRVGAPKSVLVNKRLCCRAAGNHSVRLCGSGTSRALYVSGACR